MGDSKNHEDLFSGIPPELSHIIATFLETSDVVNVALATRSWERIAAKSLSKETYAIRPHVKNDGTMTTLKEICKRSNMASAIYRVEIFVGDFQTSLFQATGEDETLDTKFQIDLERVLEGMRGNEERYLNAKDLTWVFRKLPSLNILSVTSGLYPFSDIESDFKPSWDKMLAAETGPLKPAYPYLDAAIARRRYQNIVLGLEAINKSANLSFEYMPIDCFLDLSTNVDPPGYDRWGAGSSGIIPYDGKFFNKICRNMTGFQHLKIGLGGFSKANYIDSTQPEYYTQVDLLLPRALAHFVGSFRDLRSLDLSWNIEDAKSIPWHKITFEQKWRLKFFENTWPSLKDLKLQGIGGSYDQLLAFLRKHQPTLKRVSLKHPNMLMNGGQSYRQLLSTIRETHEFEKFEFLLETDKGRIYDENWATPLDDTFSRTAFWLEQFVTKATDIWPMKHDNPCQENWWHLATAFRE